MHHLPLLYVGEHESTKELLYLEIIFYAYICNTESLRLNIRDTPIHLV
jgi:hypothetical protein